MRIILWPLGAADVDVPSSWWDTVSVGEIIIGIVAVCAILALAWKGVAAFTRVFRAVTPLENFFRDWNGEAARPGVEARPGVMERLSVIEAYIADAPTRAEVDAMREEIHRVEDSQKDQGRRIGAIEQVLAGRHIIEAAVRVTDEREAQ